MNNQHANFSVIPIALSTAGSQQIDMETDYFMFAYATDSGGGRSLSAEISVSIGQDYSDTIKLTPNNKIKGYGRLWRLSWTAQSGLTAYIFVSRGPLPLELEVPPTRQIVTSAVGTTFTTSTVTAAVTAGGTLLTAADALRQSVTIQNISGSKDVYLGPSGVTTATGFWLAPYGIFTFDKTTAAIYGITVSGTCEVRVAVEA